MSSDNTTLAIGATALFVVISQLKINVTNAYAGSLAWSNFFSRLTHSHPGRVVWVVFNTLIALLLMELDVFPGARAGARPVFQHRDFVDGGGRRRPRHQQAARPVAAGIEFKRSHLYDINPVGVGAMGIASLLSIAAFVGPARGEIQPYASFVALLLGFSAFAADRLGNWRSLLPGSSPPRAPGRGQRPKMLHLRARLRE
jgi:hypothetical protein